MDSLVGADQQSLTSSTSEDDNKWSQLCPAPYWNTAIVTNTLVTLPSNKKIS